MARAGPAAIVGGFPVRSLVNAVLGPLGRLDRELYLLLLNRIDYTARIGVKA
jgi:hypothetical protein